jgi:uncharacterized membrane protein
MRETPAERRLFHELFELSVYFKGAYSILEFFLGVAIVFIDRHLVTSVLTYFIQGEFNEDPRGWISNQILHITNHITPGTELFMGWYFIANAAAKLFLVWGLLTNRLWAYPTTVGFLALFVVYEVYRVFHTHSPVLVFLIILDSVTIFLVADEWRNRSLLNDFSGSAKQEPLL